MTGSSDSTVARTRRIALVAGEASGDLLAAHLLRALTADRSAVGEVRAFGIGGPQMAQAGFQAWSPSSDLAVRGYVEVLRRLPALLRLRRRLAQRLIDEPPDLFIGVDAPDFNLRLEERLRQAGIPVAHFVCPSIWAWRMERVHQIRRSVDRVLCLFPFEPDILAAHGIAADYVGHPLADHIPLQVDAFAARRALGLDADRSVVALLPGSRSSEISAIAPVLLQAAKRIRNERPEIQFVLPVAPGLIEQVRACVAREPLPGLHVIEGRSHEALAACDLTLIASGTATLEAALFKRPMVIVYRMNPLSWQLMKRKALQPWVGLPNILCGAQVVPECIQDDCTPQRIAQEALGWMDDLAGRSQLHDRFDQLHQQLRCNMAARASQVIGRMLESR
jgi:lipid-A-disaccharide synthase